MTPKQRLLDTITPLEYDILLRPDLKEFAFTGEETLVFQVKKPTKIISLHAVGLDVQSAVCFEGNTEHAGFTSYNKKAKTVSFQFSKTLAKGEKRLKISFKGVIGEKLKGWYKSAYTVNGEKRFLATTQFEQIGAREVFPCIDDPQAKAIFRISLLVPSHLTAISNTIDSVVAEHENGYKTVEFSPTPRMSSYALAFIVGEFEYVEATTTSGIHVRVFVTPGKKSQAQFALSTVAKMLPFYETYFDIAYPLPILDLIAIPDFDAGAMENWGAITAREVALLVDEKQTSAANKQWVATVIAHELTHMWFGNLVTMKWWDDLWLNEGFASYMEYVGVNEFFPDWNVWEQFAVLDHNRAMGLDSLEATHPIQAKITDVEKVAEIFDEVSYSKGASVIQMLVEHLGEKDFREGIRYYLKKHQYANAETQDLWDALEKVSGKKITHIMKTYTEKPGLPIISVSQSEKSLTLTQTRFFSSNLSKKSSQDRTIWSIPLKYIQESSRVQTNIVLDKTTDTIPYNGGWIKFNVGETSFVRVTYEKELYAVLQKPIEEKLLSSVDRMGLLRDVYDSAESGYVSADVALELSSQYKKETSYIVWAALAGKLGKVENLIADTVLLPAFHEYVRGLLNVMKKSTSWEKRIGDTHDDILLRGVILSSLGHYKDKETIQKAQDYFEKIKQDRNSVDTDIRGVIYGLVAENGKEKEYEILKNMYIKEDLPTEKNRIGMAMCLFEDETLIAKALNFSLTDAVRHQDIGRFLVSSFSNAKGREVTWEFIKKHWGELLEKMEGLSMDWIVEGAASVVSDDLAENIKKFFKTHPHPALDKAMRQVVEQMESNTAWLKRDRATIEKFLSNRV